MTIQEMQNIVHEWINQSKEGYFTPPWMVLRLTEELGELSREVSHVYGPKQKNLMNRLIQFSWSWAISCL